MQHFLITQYIYILFQLDLVGDVYDISISRRNSNEVEFIARNAAVLLRFATHIGKT